MIPLLIWRGHKTSTITLIAINVALISIISGMLSVAIRSTDKANDLKEYTSPTTDLVQRINTLDGIATYSFLVVAIAVIVALLMMAAIIQFNVAAASSTIRSLRVYGVSQFRTRFAFIAISIFASIVALVCSIVLAPGAGVVHRFILAQTGLNVDDVTVELSYPVIFWTTVCMSIFSCTVAFRSSKNVSLLETSLRTRARWWSIIPLVFRLAALIGVVIGLIAILRVEPTMDNVNEITFGAMFTALIATWCVFPLLVGIFGKIIKRFGSVGMAVGGLMTAESKRISGIALISSLLLGLGGTSALLTLASSSAGQYLAMTSVSADAVTDEEVTNIDSDVDISAFNFDRGWLLKGEEAEQAAIILFNPEVFSDMVDSTMIVSGQLRLVNGDNVIADADRYKLGDTIPVVDDNGDTRELRVVALSKSDSLLGGSIGADSVTFSPSDTSNINYRTYAKSRGGIEHISEALPDIQWKSIRQFVDDDLRSAQASQMASVFSMIGGVSIVALFGLLYSVVGFSVDQQRSAFSLNRMGMGKKSRLILFAFIGCVIAVSSAILAVCALLAAFSRVSDVLGSLGVTYPLSVPWGMLVGMWALTGAAAVVGMIVGQRGSSARQGHP